MANISGKQSDVRYCPACQKELRNVPRCEMKSRGYTRADGTVSPETHTYICSGCGRGFEINQDRKR